MLVLFFLPSNDLHLNTHMAALKQVAGLALVLIKSQGK
jgi:hypothetical protein